MKVVLREALGVYTAGVFVAGVKSSFSSMMSVQPVVLGRDLQVLPEGRSMNDFVKLYTSDKLQTAAESEGLQPDIIVHEGYGYAIISAEANQSGVVSHYKYIASKIFKYTSSADWVSGALKRP
jgi:hypothetical protein